MAEEDPSVLRRRSRTLRLVVQWTVYVLALVLLAAHALNVQTVQVDDTTIMLLGLILLVPLIGAIKKLKFGDAEAEIEPEEVKEITNAVKRNLTSTPPPKKERKFTPLLTTEADRRMVSDLDAFTRDDPVLGLAKLRIELERRLRAMFVDAVPHEEVPRGLWRLAADLQRRELLPAPLVSAIREIGDVANRAIHGERIRVEDAVSIARLGADVLDQLDRRL